MTIKTSSPDSTFQINTDGTWPNIVIVTDATGPHDWKWSIAWKTYNQAGTDTSPGNQWDAQQAVAGLGGTLNVTAEAGEQSASITITIKGQNPTLQQVEQYLATTDSDGYDKILNHETHMVHFNKTGEPIKSFDNGYGIAQLTSPPPTYEQVWTWTKNIDGGLVLFAAKRSAATQYLGQASRVYTPEQLKYETVCRWNGGKYHVWDPQAGAWARNPNVLCDSRTGNIGWDMTDTQNAGKTETELHARDQAQYNRAPGPGAHWKYYGVCYADSLLR